MDSENIAQQTHIQKIYLGRPDYSLAHVLEELIPPPMSSTGEAIKTHFDISRIKEKVQGWDYRTNGHFF